MTDGWWALANVAAAAVPIAGMVLVTWYNRREWAKLRAKYRQKGAP